jgi:hypothetical protein
MTGVDQATNDGKTHENTSLSGGRLVEVRVCPHHQSNKIKLANQFLNQLGRGWPFGRPEPAYYYLRNRFLEYLC